MIGHIPPKPPPSDCREKRYISQVENAEFRDSKRQMTPSRQQISERVCQPPIQPMLPPPLNSQYLRPTYGPLKSIAIPPSPSFESIRDAWVRLGKKMGETLEKTKYKQLENLRKDIECVHNLFTSQEGKFVIKVLFEETEFQNIVLSLVFRFKQVGHTAKSSSGGKGRKTERDYGPIQKSCLSLLDILFQDKEVKAAFKRRADKPYIWLKKEQDYYSKNPNKKPSEVRVFLEWLKSDEGVSAGDVFRKLIPASFTFRSQPYERCLWSLKNMFSDQETKADRIGKSGSDGQLPPTPPSIPFLPLELSHNPVLHKQPPYIEPLIYQPGMMMMMAMQSQLEWNQLAANNLSQFLQYSMSQPSTALPILPDTLPDEVKPTASPKPPLPHEEKIEIPDEDGCFPEDMKKFFTHR
jgi:hypothetical protein